ncbi:MAG: 3-methyl-2-oxobutanoate dehydrogenase subunit VorB [Desulforudis sp.]|nr:3-methyl-2-oxobutanoate dehydrogenase subunit VorB [Clostridia bacterium]MDQ7791957.1 3-methyl-2-oxobutanoate dehydrogenase subunit VorB [Clostridia bacterium]RJX21884.1 MAG: 3-methyl-2-oxobutanoate dehydrogenase subunit VorB [Desulforudis sp.]
MPRTLMKGNEAFGEGAIRAGCRHFFGYPITPQSEVPHYLAKRLPECGGVFLQAESETASINMAYGAAAAGARVLTSSSSPGISLMQEGLSYLVGSELPCVVVNVMRGGPGLGNIAPAQADYYQAVKGGGHGDYRVMVLAPASVQEIIELMETAFELADQYRNPVMVLGDGILGQMMEPVDLDGEGISSIPSKPWAVTGTQGRTTRNIVNSMCIVPEENEAANLRLANKYNKIRQNEQRWEEYLVNDAEVILVAFGTLARVVKAVADRARDEGIRAGVIRPVTLWPFPDQAFEKVIKFAAKRFLVVELNLGQMLEDVRLAVNGRRPVHFYGRPGGVVPTVREVMERLKQTSEVTDGGDRI